MAEQSPFEEQATEQKKSAFSAASWKIPNLMIIYEVFTLATHIKAQPLKCLYYIKKYKLCTYC